MSTNKNAFQNVLKVANAESFEVVEGGFLVTEEHLNTVDAKLGQDATVLKATADQLAALQAKETDLSKVTALEAQLKTANEQLTAANAKVVTLEAENKKLSEEGKEFSSAVKSFTKSAITEADKPVDAANAEEVFNIIPSPLD